jgi:hypothetical protein
MFSCTGRLVSRYQAHNQAIPLLLVTSSGIHSVDEPERAHRKVELRSLPPFALIRQGEPPCTHAIQNVFFLRCTRKPRTTDSVHVRRNLGCAVFIPTEGFGRIYMDMCMVVFHQILVKTA